MSNFKKTILSLAAYYGHDLTKEQLDIYADQLSRSLSESEANSAALKYIDDPTNEFFPRPVSKLIALVKSPVKPADLAQQAAALIKQAVIDKQSSWATGYYWGRHPDTGEHLFYFEGKNQNFWTWREAAENTLGPLGLAIVDHLGGWQKVCERFNESPDTVVWPQLLKSGEAVQSIHKYEKENTLPALPEKSKEVLKLVSVKSIGDGSAAT